MSDERPTVEDYVPAQDVLDQARRPGAQCQLIDNDCFLCVGIPKEVPEGIEAWSYFYAFGFAEGVSQALRGAGYHLCERHVAIVRKACVERGINWGKPVPQQRRIIGG